MQPYQAVIGGLIYGYYDKKQRSERMSKIKGSDTKIENIIRKHLFGMGFRYRKNDKRLPGKPDIYLPKYRTVIFVNGCFWHCHNCKIGHIPRSNKETWEDKLNRNKSRDERNYMALKQMGLNVLIVWECELTNKRWHETLENLVNAIKEFNVGTQYGE